MLALIVGLIVVGIPVGIAGRVAWRVVRKLGAFDASLMAEALRAHDLAVDACARATDADADSVAARVFASLLAEDARTTSVIARKMALSEAVAEIERELTDDARVPRVAASLSSTSGLLAATLVMRSGLTSVVGGPSGEAILAMQDVVDRALSVATLAVLGGVTCAALHRVAQRQRRLRLDEMDALAEALLALDVATTPDRSRALPVIDEGV